MRALASLGLLLAACSSSAPADGGTDAAVDDGVYACCVDPGLYCCREDAGPRCCVGDHLNDAGEPACGPSPGCDLETERCCDFTDSGVPMCQPILSLCHGGGGL